MSIMLKKGIVKRLTISSLALLILLITYLFPTKIETNAYKQNLSYVETQKGSIYLLNKENYVSRVNMVINNKETLAKVKEIINLLTIKSKENEYLPADFYGVIPSGTQVNTVTLEEGLLKIDFSKEFLNTDIEMERKMVESLVYSLTEIPEVKSILLFVEGNQLLELPYSKEKLPTLLNKEFGVNKIYDLENIKNTTKTTVYYGSKTNELFYYIPVTYVSNNQNEKVEIIIEKLKSSPIYESNLISFLNANAEITNYEIKENEIKLSFNEFLLEGLDQSTILEEVQYTIFLSLRDTYNIEQVEFSVQKDEKNVNLVINALE